MNNKTRTKRVIAYIVLYLISLGILASVIILPQAPQRDSTLLQKLVIFASFIFLTKYFIYMAISPWYDTILGLRELRNSNRIKTYKPKVSVLIPAWNEAVGILGTIRSILANSYENLEIIVINDGSTDNSDEILRAFEKEYIQSAQGKEGKKDFIYIYKENGGKAEALNKGLEVSHGDIIITIDADCVVQRDAVRNFVARFSDPKVMAAVGNVKVANTNSFIAVIQHLEFLFSFYLKRADSLLGSIYIIGGAAGAFRREVFEKLGGYSTKNLTEDIELTVRIQKAGMKIVYAADAVVYTEGASDTQGLSKQRLRWKKGRIDTFIEHKNLFFSSQKGHNKFLTWFVMPFALLGDTELLVELPFMLFLCIYAYMAKDPNPFLALFSLITFAFFVQVFVSDRKYNTKSIYTLAPIAWLMFYFITYIEIKALINSLLSLYKKREIKWQRWERKGIIS
jgi:poly-beta-1,6-N-acetyl-D-glucosamine synthase